MDTVTGNPEAIPGGKFHRGHLVPSVLDEHSYVTKEVGPDAPSIVNNYRSDKGKPGPECITSTPDLPKTYYVGIHRNLEECYKNHLPPTEKNGPRTAPPNHIHGMNGPKIDVLNAANHTNWE